LIVLDASALLDLLLGTTSGWRLAERIRPFEISLHAPHLIDIEVTQAVRKYVLSGSVSAERGRLALRHLADLDLERYPHTPLLPRIWALRENLTAYDAAYVALAEVLDATLLTSDRCLAAAPGILADVELI
jgi:predicted nucleic acid-binding protein